MASRKTKSWNRSKQSQTFSKRRAPSKEVLPSILVVCEGEKTEPQYFESFRVPGLKLKILPAGRQHLSLVKLAIREVSKDPDYDEIWCVFDRDKNPRDARDVEKFNSSISMAERNGFKVAYSNDAFELWYLLHFIYFESQISRADYISKLSSYIPGGYTKNDPDIYAKLEPYMVTAIRNAKKLHSKAKGIKPVDADPSTMVYQLVEKLKKYSRRQI